MKAVRDVALTVAAFGVLLSLTLGTSLPGLLLAEQAAPTTAGTPAPEPEEEEVSGSSVEPSALAAQPGSLEVAPTQIVIPGHKSCPGKLCEGKVAYSPAWLTVRIVPTATITPTAAVTSTVTITPSTAIVSSAAPTSTLPITPTYQFFHPPINSKGVAAYLTITDAHECEAQVFTSFGSGQVQPTGLRCFRIEADGDLPPGVYTSTLKVSAGQGSETSANVNVSVTVGLAKWWPVLTVIIGVLATEFLSLWGKRWRYAVAWKNLRARWLDLLSERLEWATLFKDDSEDSENEAVRQVKAELRGELSKLSEWLNKGRKGEVTIDKMPANLDAAKEKVYPLKRAVDRYLDSSLGLTGLPGQLKQLADEAAKEAATNLKSAADTTKSKLHTPLQNFHNDPKYETLKEKWVKGPKPTDKTLLAAWNVIREIVEEKPKELGDEFSPVQQHISDLSPTPAIASLASAVKELTEHLNAFKSEVVDAAKGQQAPVVGVGEGEDGKSETVDVLKALVKLEASVNQADKQVTSANQPLKYYIPDGAVSRAMNKLEGTLKTLDAEIDKLTFNDLSDHAVHEMMLKPVREGLEAADGDMSQPQTDMQAVWGNLDLTYAKNQGMVRVGRQLEGLKKKWSEENECWSAIENHVKRGYQLLLGGDVLGAQIELERAESKVWSIRLEKLFKQIGLEKASQVLARRASRLPPSWFQFDKSTVEQSISSWIRDFLYALGLALLIALVVLSAVFPAWRWTLVALALLLLSVQAVRVLRQWRLGILLNELLENFWPAVVQSLLGASSQILTIAIAVAVVIVYNKLANIADTWGSFFDFATAFTWGVVANRTAKPLQSGWEKLVESLGPQVAEQED